MRRFLVVALVVVLSVVLAGCQVPGQGSQSGAPSSDRLGWEDGHWYDDELSVTPADGLNASELNATVARAMARVEQVRRLEFEERVPVKVINRSTYRNRSGGDHGPALQRFDNAKFEAMFLVGEDSGSIEEQEETRSSTVAGYYSPGQDAIVVVSESPTPTLSSEQTLAHELVHALQDQHFDLGNLSADTRDAYQGRNGLIEGDASYTQREYMSRCGESWSCLSVDDESEAPGGGDRGASDVHLGLYILEYFPYSEGPNFVGALHERGGWSAVNDAYEEIPEGATEVIDERAYPEWEPTNVSLGTVGGDWEQVRPANRTAYGVLGQSAITASLGYTVYDEYNAEESVVSPFALLNRNASGGLDVQQPFNYSIDAADGWTGGRFVAYQPANGDDGDDGNELAYAWRTEWDSPADAEQFGRAWGQLIRHWGGSDVGEDTYVVDSGPYADAFRVTVDDATVTVVNAPERSDLAAFEDV